MSNGGHVYVDELTVAAEVDFVEIPADPAAQVNRGRVYTKDVLGVTQLFYIASDGTVTQITPLTSAGPWDTDATTIYEDDPTKGVGIGTTVLLPPPLDRKLTVRTTGIREGIETQHLVVGENAWTVFNAGEVAPRVQITSNGVYGTGSGAAPIDTTLSRVAPGEWDMNGSLSVRGAGIGIGTAAVIGPGVIRINAALAPSVIYLNNFMLDAFGASEPFARSIVTDKAVLFGTGVVAEDTSLARTGVGELTLTDLFGGNPTLLPGGGFNFGNLGTSTAQWNSVAATNVQLFGAAADVNPRYLVTNTGGFQAGAGGASGIDTQMLRNVAGRWDMVVDDATTNANVDLLALQHTTSGVAAGNIAAGLLFLSEDNAGVVGISAARISGVLTSTIAGAVDGALDFWTRQAGGALTQRWRVATAGGLIPFADNSYNVGTASLRVSAFNGVLLRTFGALGDANPNAQVGAKALQLGEGGATALDWALTHNAAGNRADLGANDEMGANGTGFFSVRNAVGNANPTAKLLDASLLLGATSAEALNVRLLALAGSILQIDNGAAGALTVRGGADNNLTLGTATIRLADVAAVQLRVFTAAADANASASLSSKTVNLGEGGAVALDWALTHNAAGNRADLGADDELSANGTGFFSYRAAVGDANPTCRLNNAGLFLGLNSADNLSWSMSVFATNRVDMGSGDEFNAIGAGFLNVRFAAVDANPTFQASSGAVKLGLNSADNLSWQLTVAAATNRADMGANDELGANGTGFFSVRNAVGNANPTAKIGDNNIQVGTNSADNLSCLLKAQAANTWETGSGDAFYAVNAILGRRGASGDVNATAQFTGSQMDLGAGGATAVDSTILRQAANVFETGSGDAFYAVNAILGRRNASGDVNATAQFTGSQMDLGAGGATAVDSTILRQAANVFETGSGDAFFAVNAVIGRKTASGDANAVALFGIGNVLLGAGGATAPDVRIARTSPQTLTIDDNNAGAADINVVPVADGNGNIGTAAKRWKLVRAVTITSGDLGFDDAGCALCGRGFAVSEDLVLRVVAIEPDVHGSMTRTVPVHQHCAARGRA